MQTTSVQLRQPAFVAKGAPCRAQARARSLVACRAQQQAPVELGRKAAAVSWSTQGGLPVCAGSVRGCRGKPYASQGVYGHQCALLGYLQ